MRYYNTNADIFPFFITSLRLHCVALKKNAHLLFSAPGLRTVVDVGGNKGYLASLFLSLWGGGGYLTLLIWGIHPLYGGSL